MNSQTRPANQFSLSIFWFAWEVHWAALLGAAMQAQVARFIAPGFIGEATAVLSGAGALFSIVSQYIAGRASDATRRRMPFIIAGTACDVLALFGFALAPSFVTVVAAFAAVQISLNVACGPYQALIPDRVVRSRQGGASAIMALYRLSGNAIGLLLAKLLVVQPGPAASPAAVEHGLLLLSASLSAVLVIALAITVAGVRDEATAGTPAAHHALAAWPERASFTWLIVSRSLVSMGLYLILPFFAFYLRFALHIANYLQSNLSLLLLMTVFSLAGALPAGFLGDRISKKSIMFAALAVLALCAASLAQVRSASLLVPIAIVLGVGWGAYYSVDWALACNLVPERRAGAIMALWNIGASGPQVLSPVIGGIVADRVGAAFGDLGAGYRILFAFVAAYVIAGSAALLMVRERRAGKDMRIE